MRNRMIKAEFWADEKVAACSFVARLLFIGSWNFADDSGVCRANSLYLRNNIFPYDSINIKQIDEAKKQLEDAKLIKIAEYKKEKYFLIENFSKHQQINRPSKFRYIDAEYPDIFEIGTNTHDNLCSTHGVFSEDSLLKEKEKVKVKVKEEETTSTNEKQYDDFSFYGEYSNVGLTKIQYNKLLTLIMNNKILNELIDNLCRNIEIGKETRFSYDLPNKHFEILKNYWNWRRKNPNTLNETNKTMSKNNEMWSLSEVGK